jgi:hypothetical protein
LTVLTVKISPFLRFLKQLSFLLAYFFFYGKEEVSLRRSTKDAVFGNCKPSVISQIFDLVEISHPAVLGTLFQA